MQGMPPPTYHVFVRQDGSYGVALSQLGAMIRTATGFAAESEAREWVERDRLLELGNNPIQDVQPSMPRAY
jgi:hypothetical protein